MSIVITIIMVFNTHAQFPGLLYSPVSVLPNMKLAEFRYGREEMLALFDKNVRGKKIESENVTFFRNIHRNDPSGEIS